MTTTTSSDLTNRLDPGNIVQSTVATPDIIVQQDRLLWFTAGGIVKPCDQSKREGDAPRLRLICSGTQIGLYGYELGGHGFGDLRARTDFA